MRSIYQLKEISYNENVISTDGEYVSEHFGRCPNFTIVNIQNNKIVKKEIIANPGHHPSFLPQYFNEKGANCIISGGMGKEHKYYLMKKHSNYNGNFWQNR